MKRPQNPWNYRWSSHRAYLGKPAPVTIQTTSVLKQFGFHAGAARRRYLGFMKEGLCEGHLDRFYETIEQRFLGDERFVDDVEKKKEEGSRQGSRLNFPVWWMG
jgi:hypothetical protein